LRLKDNPDPGRRAKAVVNGCAERGPGRPSGIKAGGRSAARESEALADPRVQGTSHGWKFPNDGFRNHAHKQYTFPRKGWFRSSKLPRKAQELVLDSFHHAVYFTVGGGADIFVGARDLKYLTKKHKIRNLSACWQRKFQQTNLSEPERRDTAQR
jgi:hypothetical protein